jgi:hypothetical protein
MVLAVTVLCGSLVPCTEIRKLGINPMADRHLFLADAEIEDPEPTGLW